MPTSDSEAISAILELVIQMQPQSVLDIGVGFGKMGLLCREYLDIWNGKYKPHEWETVIDGLEIFQEYETPVYKHCYNNVFFGNVMDYLDIMSKYELVLIIDIIEHLSKVDGKRLLEAIVGNYIVSTPRIFHSDQSLAFGNENERHISRWYPSEFSNSRLLERQFLGWKGGN